VKKRRKQGRRGSGLQGDGSLVRGFIAAGCISAFQDVARPATTKNLKRVLRHALPGGTALTAGSRAAEAPDRGDYGRALMAAAAGAAGVLIIENVLRDGAADNRE
jgi:hypothetical protein